MEGEGIDGCELRWGTGKREWIRWGQGRRKAGDTKYYAASK